MELCSERGWITIMMALCLSRKRGDELLCAGFEMLLGVGAFRGANREGVSGRPFLIGYLYKTRFNTNESHTLHNKNAPIYRNTTNLTLINLKFTRQHIIIPLLLRNNNLTIRSKRITILINSSINIRVSNTPRRSPNHLDRTPPRRRRHVGYQF